jgi:hypothetical protein
VVEVSSESCSRVVLFAMGFWRPRLIGEENYKKGQQMGAVSVCCLRCQLSGDLQGRLSNCLHAAGAQNLLALLTVLQLGCNLAAAGPSQIGIFNHVSYLGGAELSTGWTAAAHHCTSKRRACLLLSIACPKPVRVLHV